MPKTTTITHSTVEVADREKVLDIVAELLMREVNNISIEYKCNEVIERTDSEYIKTYTLNRKYIIKYSETKESIVD